MGHIKRARIYIIIEYELIGLSNSLVINSKNCLGLKTKKSDKEWINIKLLLTKINN